MSKIAKTTIDELAKMVSALDFESVLTFATEYVGDTSQSENDYIDDYEEWYYIQKRCNSEYASEYWVIDRCGGGYTCAYPDEFDYGFDDYMIAQQLTDYLRGMEINHGKPFDGFNVYVDMEDDK